MVLINELTNDVEADLKAANEAVLFKLHVAAMNGFS